MGTTRPNAQGGMIAVSDSDALALLDANGLPPGTRVFNADVGHNFAYTISTAALDPDVVVEVKDTAGARWILDTSDAEVQSVTGDFVDNTDPRNPVIDATDAVTNAMLAEMATHTFKANITAGTANPTDITRTELTAELNAASASLPGSLSVADFNKLAGMTGDWFVNMDAFVLPKAPTLTTKALRSDCQDTLQFTTSTAGTGVAAAVAVDQSGGVILMSTGATNGGRSELRNLGATTIGVVSNARTQAWALATRAKALDIPAGTGTVSLLVMSDFATAEVYLSITPSTVATNFTAGVTGVAATNTGVPYDTGYHDFVMIADGTNVRFYIDGVLVATKAQATAANASGRYQHYIDNGNQSAVVRSHTDKVAVYTLPPT